MSPPIDHLPLYHSLHPHPIVWGKKECLKKQNKKNLSFTSG